MKRIINKQNGIMLISLVIMIVLIILIAFLIAILTGENETLDEEILKEKIIQSTFIWNVDSVNLSKLNTQVERLGINTLYVQIPRDLETSMQIKKIINFCKLKNIDLYLLDGDNDWYMEEERHNVIETIDKVSEFNKKVDYIIKGIKFDIEFYTTDFYKSLESKEDKITEFQKFYEANKEFSEYAKEKELKYAIDLPVWLNRLDERILEEIVKLDYDHIAYMNYDRPSSMKNLDEEVELAKKYDKKLVNIFELQNPEDHEGLPDTDTYYKDGLEVCEQKMNEILQKYNYYKLGKSYHEYKSLIEVIERENPEEANKYELELYPYCDGKSIEIKSAQLTDENGKVFPSIPTQYNTEKSQEYIITFFGLEFGKEYNLKINEGNYTYNGTINNVQDSDYIKYDTILLNKE